MDTRLGLSWNVMGIMAAPCLESYRGRSVAVQHEVGYYPLPVDQAYKRVPLYPLITQGSLCLTSQMEDIGTDLECGSTSQCGMFTGLGRGSLGDPRSLENSIILLIGRQKSTVVPPS